MQEGAFQVVGNLPGIIRNDAGLYEGDLRHYFKLLFHEAENIFNPYHNFGHNCGVAWLCHDAIAFYVRIMIDQIGTLRQRRNLLIAGMTHDFNHISKKVPDAANIERATEFLRERCHPDDRCCIEEIEELIRCTEYPHKHLSQPSLRVQIIRDADMVQAMSPMWIQQVVFGLAHEWGQTPIEVLKAQEKFCLNLNFTTEWASWRFPQSSIENKLLEIRELIDILE